jgi:S1-C subfamily serine protease
MAKASMRRLIAKSRDSVVLVESRDFQSQGTGFLVGNCNTLLTNAHVVSRFEFDPDGKPIAQYARNLWVCANGVYLKAEVISDTESIRPLMLDYALLRLEREVPATPLVMGKINRVKAGDRVLCLGYPLGFREVISTDGIVSAIVSNPVQINPVLGLERRTIVSNAIIQHGSSGGPMFDVRTSKVIGINTFRHPVADSLTGRLMQWASLLKPRKLTVLSDIIAFALHTRYVGFNHAVSIEHVRNDSSFKDLTKGAKRWHS